VGTDLAFALELADLADTLSLPRFRAADLHVDTKPDRSPVTDADTRIERALRERIAAERPGEGVLGEEEGDEGGDVRWILDPIDGTRNFSRGIPVWATLIALEREGRIVCGVASAPALGHRWWASRGEGAFRDAERLSVSRIERLEAATGAGVAYALRVAYLQAAAARDRELAALDLALWLLAYSEDEMTIPPAASSSSMTSRTRVEAPG